MKRVRKFCCGLLINLYGLVNKHITQHERTRWLIESICDIRLELKSFGSVPDGDSCVVEDRMKAQFQMAAGVVASAPAPDEDAPMGAAPNPESDYLALTLAVTIKFGVWHNLHVCACIRRVWTCTHIGRSDAWTYSYV